MRKLVLTACAFRFLDTFLLIVPFYVVMFAERGLTPAQIGVALAAWSATGLVLEIPSGVLADRASRRWMLFASQIARAAGFALWVVVPSFWGFLAGLILWGVKSAMLSGTFEALVFDELRAAGREDDYARVMGRCQGARFAGAMAASLGAAALVGVMTYPQMVWASVGACLAAAVTALALPKAPKAASTGRTSYFGHLIRGGRDAVRLPGVLSLLIFISAAQAIVLACADYWQLFGQAVGLPAAGIALFVAAMYAVGVAVSILAHRAKSASPVWLYVLVAAAGACLVAAAATFQVWSVLLTLVFVALYWVVEVNLDARFQHALAPETRATVASVKGFATQSATTVLILSFGLIAQAGGYRASFLAFGVGLTVLGLVYAASVQANFRSSTNIS